MAIGLGAAALLGAGISAGSNLLLKLKKPETGKLKRLY